MADFTNRKKKEGATESLNLPMGPIQKERYRKIQSEFDRLGLESLHISTRERIDQMLDEAERFLSERSAS